MSARASEPRGSNDGEGEGTPTCERAGGHGGPPLRPIAEQAARPGEDLVDEVALAGLVDGVEVARDQVGKDCNAPGVVGQAPKGARLQLGADDTVSSKAADHTWRGQLDEARFLFGALPPKDLMCSLRVSR